MVDEDLAVNAEDLVEVFLVILGSGGNVAHGEHICLLQPPCFPTTDLPEIRQRSVIPEQKFVRKWTQSFVALDCQGTKEPAFR